MEQDSDCWEKLIEHIKVNSSRLVSYFKREFSVEKGIDNMVSDEDSGGLHHEQ